MPDTQPTILLTGAEGFVGSHLLEYLLSEGYTQIHGTYFSNGSSLAQKLPPGNTHQVDLSEQAAVDELLQNVQPTWIVHLAAWSVVGSSFAKAEAVMQTNTKLQLTMLEAMRQYAPKARLLAIGSAQAYGIVPAAYQGQPLNEETPFYPSNPYAVSKLTQEMLSRSYQLSYDLDIIMVRPFNQIGPGQTADFVVPAFAKQIVRIERGEQENLSVGNLEAVRDFTDVRDAVRAYEKLLQQALTGEVYNLGSGQGVSIQTVLDELVALSTADITVVSNPSRMRPSDVPFFVADNQRLRSLGWEPTYTLRQTLADVLEYERRQTG